MIFNIGGREATVCSIYNIVHGQRYNLGSTFNNKVSSKKRTIAAELEKKKKIEDSES